jgi:type I restriction enzyme R subunit
MSQSFTESVVEEAALDWLEGLGYAVVHGREIAVGESSAERSDHNYRDVVLERRLRETVEPLVLVDLRFENAEKIVGVVR